MPNSFLNLLIFYAEIYKYIQNVHFLKSKFILMKTFMKTMIRMCQIIVASTDYLSDF